MRTILAAAAAICLFGVGAWADETAVSLGLCQKDDEIAAATKSEFEKAAFEFSQKVLAFEIADAYASMTEMVRASIPEAKIESTLADFLKTTGTLTDLKFEHAYYLVATGTGPIMKVPCGSLDDDNWVMLNSRPGTTQAHVVLSAKSRNNDWAITVWLVREDEAWHVQYFNIAMSTMVGIDARQMLDMARKERAAGHAFNAYMLYVGVEGLMQRGSAFQLGFEQTFKKDVGGYQPPPELAGSPPYTWVMNRHSYRVAHVVILGVDGKLGLIFALPGAAMDDQEADRANRAFLDDFRVAHPEYAAVFGFLVARAMKPDNNSYFGTVYQNGKGYE